MGRPAWQQYERARKTYDEAWNTLNVELRNFLDRRRLYEEKYWAASTSHEKACTPLVERYGGVELPCDKSRKQMREQFFARAKVPECAVGFETASGGPSARLSTAGLGGFL